MKKEIKANLTISEKRANLINFLLPSIGNIVDPFYMMLAIRQHDLDDSTCHFLTSNGIIENVEGGFLIKKQL